jgi:uncharacterized membrane protein
VLEQTAPSDLPEPSRGLAHREEIPVLALSLRPNRSLTQRGVTWVMGLVAVGLAVPLVPLGGTSVGWGMLPFLVAALAGLAWAFRRSFEDGRLTEEFRLWPDLVTVERIEPNGAVRRWHANPFWVRPRLIENASIEKYLTLTGNGREIELGAFLSPWEREALFEEISAALGRLRAAPTPQSG